MNVLLERGRMGAHEIQSFTVSLAGAGALPLCSDATSHRLIVSSRSNCFLIPDADHQASDAKAALVQSV